METRSSEIVFACAHCATSFVVDAAAAGMTLNCQNCGQPTRVPAAARADDVNVLSPPVATEQQADLEGRLKENESQRTEVTSYINQLSIQLHRWKLRLQTLNERKAKLEAEMTSTAK